MRYLIVAHLTADSLELRTWLEATRSTDSNFRSVLLVPTSPRSYWKTWDVLEDLHAAEARANRAQSLFEEAGIAVERVVIGSREPLSAIEDELREDPNFDAIVIATLPPGLSRWLRLDLIHQCRRRTGLPVTHVLAHTADWDSRAGRHDGLTRQADGVVSRGSAPSSRVPAEVATATVPLSVPGRGDDVQTGQATDPTEDSKAMDVAPTRLALTLQQTPAIAQAFWSLGSQLEWHSGLEPLLVETVALRVACKRRFVELWQEHVRIARALGMPDARIAALEHWASAEHVRFNEGERAVLAYVDAACQEGDAVVEARQFLERYFDQPQIVAITLMTGFYRMAGSFAHALSLGTDEPFVGWSLFRGEAGRAHL